MLTILLYIYITGVVVNWVIVSLLVLIITGLKDSQKEKEKELYNSVINLLDESPQDLFLIGFLSWYLWVFVYYE